MRRNARKTLARAGTGREICVNNRNCRSRKCTVCNAILVVFERAVILRCHYPGVKSLMTAVWLWFKCLVVPGRTGWIPGDGGIVGEWWGTLW